MDAPAVTTRACKRCRAEFDGVGPAAYCSRECRYRERMDRVAENDRRRAPFRQIHTAGCRPSGDEVPAECWCGEHIVGVPLDLVRACLTGSCGTPGCGPELLRKGC